MAVWAGFATGNHKISTNYNEGGNNPRLVLVHIMAGYLAGTDSWFNNPQAQASAHFGVGKNGEIHQYVAINDTAWHAAEANSYSVGVENEGFGGDALTQAQLDANAKIFEWVHRQYPAVKLWLNTHPFTGSGLSYHGAGVPRWGTHPACPGSRIVAQLPTIVKRAQALAAPATITYADNPVKELAVKETRFTQADLNWKWSHNADGGYDVTYDAENVDKKTKHARKSEITLKELKRHTTYTASVIARPAGKDAKRASIQFTTK